MFLSATNTNYNSRLEGIVQQLSEAQAEKKAILARAVDAQHDKGVIANKIREMDDAFKIYMVGVSYCQK
jgi:hypothetical protein